jgi:organic radical activating enzyme
MKYILLSLTNSCNKSCDYCVMKKWRNNPNFLDKITIPELIEFFETKVPIDPGDVVEITGGEPTLIPELPILLDYLQDSMAKVILRTNGFRLGHWREMYDNLIVVLSRHDSDSAYIERLKPLLKPWDIIQTGDGTDKKVYQDPNSWVPIFQSHGVRHEFANAYTISNDGTVCFMYCDRSHLSECGTIWDFHDHHPFHICDSCPYFLGAWELASWIGKSRQPI